MTYVLADCIFDTRLYTLQRAGRLRQLRPKVFQVLRYLLEHRDRVISKHELAEQVWPEQFISDGTMESCIKAVRQVLGDTGRTQRFVQTLHGYGYRFIAAVEEGTEGMPEAAPDLPDASVLSHHERTASPALLPSSVASQPSAAPRLSLAPEAPHPLRKLLDKQKTNHLLQTFVDLMPEVTACWVVGPEGQCFLGYPDQTEEDWRAFVEAVSQTGEAIIRAPYGVCPVLMSNACGGAIVAQFTGPTVSPDVLTTLRLLGATLSQLASSGAERKAILLDALEKYRELSLLYTIAEAIGAALSAVQIAQVVLDTSRKIIRAEHGSIMLLHPDTEALEIQAAYGVEQPRKASLKKGVGIAGLVAQTGVPEIVNDTHADARFVQYTGMVRALLCVPLKIHETILGVMNVSNPLSGRMFTARDAKFLMTLASQATIAIENARLMAALHEKNQALECTLQQWQTSTGRYVYAKENLDRR